MLVARILYPIEVLGIGRRIGIWLCGCNHRCPGCSNPELWEFDKTKNVSVGDLYDSVCAIFQASHVDGFTITGGEPFEQSGELSELIIMLNKFSRDIIVYSGYTLAELKAKKEPAVENILNRIAVLIDGRYVERRNNGVFMRGSDNQTAHILDKSFDAVYTGFFRSGTNKIQNFHTSGGTFSIGIHKAGFNEDIGELLEKRDGL